MAGKIYLLGVHSRCVAGTADLNMGLKVLLVVVVGIVPLYFVLLFSILLLVLYM